jgi:hypothetical protein
MLNKKEGLISLIPGAQSKVCPSDGNVIRANGLSRSTSCITYPESKHTHIFRDIQYYRIKRKVIHEKMPSEFRIPNIFLFFLYSQRFPTCKHYAEWIFTFVNIANFGSTYSSPHLLPPITDLLVSY